MPESAVQSYATHRRIDPMYHYAGFGLVLAVLVLAVVLLVRQPGLLSAWVLLASLVLALLFLRLRIYALHNQDRLIRLEETRRMERVLPEPLRARIPELAIGQFVALRFAPDAELPSLVEQALAGRLQPDEIKRRIAAWRPDTFRI
jgi:hypothetical protein